MTSLLAQQDLLGGPSCGSGVSTHFVPDWIFKPACDWHDWCYSCEGEAAGYSTQASCDDKFLSIMSSTCDGLAALSPALYLSCKAAAFLYFSAVSALGKSAFDEARKDCEECDE